MRQIEDEPPPMVAYIYDPELDRAGQVVRQNGAYAAQVNGKAIILTDPEGAVEAAWLMLEKRVSLLPPVPVKRGGAA